ncbi:MAG: hypothetical protein JWQ62_1351, partial [Lacunisphaera sp.]|nr:hypothetical protein [Lacunisphaera sp.]
DQSGITAGDLARHHFSSSPVGSVISATATIDVSGGRSAWESRMNRQARREARKAVKEGVAVQPGGRQDLALFFALMCESCRRQNTHPNPGRLELLEALWDLFHPHVMLGFAVTNGETMAGLLMIGHGRRLTFWKKGWNASGTKLYANCLLMVEALSWAHDRGYETVDFAGLDHRIAETLISGGLLDESQRRSRHMFNLRLGAEPRILPPARLLVLNPALRQLHKICSQCRPLDNWLMQRLGGAG